MKKIFEMLLMLALFAAGCGAEVTGSGEPVPPEETLPADSAAPAQPDAADPLPAGTTETFTYGALVLEVSGVCEVRTESKLAEGIQPYEETVYTCSPGAVLTVVSADMSDPAYTEDHTAHPQWGLYDFETDTRTPLTDETEPIPLDETTDMVFSLESSVGVLSFEFAE